MIYYRNPNDIYKHSDNSKLIKRIKNKKVKIVELRKQIKCVVDIMWKISR